MLFVVDADLPRRIALLLRERGHEAVDVRDVGLGAAPDPQIAAYARKRRACLLTADLGFADVRNYPPEGHFGLAVLRLHKGANSPVIAGLVESFLEQADVLERLPGRLAIVQPGRIRLRPA